MNDEYVQDYLESFAKTMADIPAREIREIGEVLLDAFERKAWVYLAGNGGSAALATHLACDLEKTSAGKRPLEVDDRFRVMSLADNLATLTAWSNDEGYEHVFAEGLRTRAERNDVLLVITASGNSPNILRALEQAKSMGMKTIGWLGFDGGKAKELCDHTLHIQSRDYGIVEGGHGVFVHMLTRWLTQSLEGLRESSERKVG